MGRGDRKTRKGKIWRGSHGNTRPREEGKKQDVPAAPRAPAKR